MHDAKIINYETVVSLKLLVFGLAFIVSDDCAYGSKFSI